MSDQHNPVPFSVAVDVMGGDFAPRPIVEGAVSAARASGAAVRLVGRPDVIEDVLAGVADRDQLRVSVVPAAECVAMAEAPAPALRRKPQASIRIALEQAARSDVAAVVSAGNTGATVMAARTGLGLVSGVDRPALAVTIPTRTGTAVLLDAGANAECRPSHLVQFAVMGAVFAQIALGGPQPRVGLLSIGEEEGKGNDLTREAHQRLKSAPVRFVGNVEARDVYAGVADVIVCDGFTGNVALKISEGLVDMIVALAGEDYAEGLLRRLTRAEHGGALLLGVRGIVIVGHGRSSSADIERAIALAGRFAGQQLVARLERGLAAIPVPS